MKNIQEKQNYSIFSNFKYANKMMQSKMGWKFHFEDLLFILSGVASPFLGMAFPSVAIVLLSGSRPFSHTLGLILLYVIGMKLLSMMMSYYNNRQQMNYFLGRIFSMDPLREHVLAMDFESLESKDGKSKLRGAYDCVYSGNDRGLEAFIIQFPKLMMNLIGFSLYSILVIQISMGVFVFMLLTAIGLSLLNLRIGKFSNENQKSSRALFIKRKNAFEETMDNRSRGDVIMYQMKNWLSKKLYDIRDEYKDYFKKFSKVESNTAMWVIILNFFRDAVVYFVLIGQIRNGLIDVSTLVLMVGVISTYSKWMQEILSSVQKIVINNESVNSFRTFLEYGSNDVEDNEDFNVKASYDIRLENVSYRYEGAESDVISNINLTIRKGEKIALVGSNGAGKTTLVKLISGLYTPTSGKIYINGVDTQTLSKKQLFSSFSVVFQEMKVYACSIAENISCSLKPDREKVMSCLMKAGLWEKVHSFEKGIDTAMTQKLDQSGVHLSGGQNQKLMLARALYQDAPILILDEPTAALDPIAENEMYQAYHEFSGDKTSLFISHRLSSTRFCDRVCFLKGGRISEMGTHESLMANNGDYAKMFSIQSRYYQEDETVNLLEEAI